MKTPQKPAPPSVAFIILQVLEAIAKPSGIQLFPPGLGGLLAKEDVAQQLNQGLAALFGAGVLDSILSELAHQARKWPGHKHTPGEWVGILRHQVENADRAWYHGHGDDSTLHEFRQIAAVAIAAMSHHGAPCRGDQVEDTPQSERFKATRDQDRVDSLDALVYSILAREKRPGGLLSKDGPGALGAFYGQKLYAVPEMPAPGTTPPAAPPMTGRKAVEDFLTQERKRMSRAAAPVPSSLKAAPGVVPKVEAPRWAKAGVTILEAQEAQGCHWARNSVNDQDNALGRAWCHRFTGEIRYFLGEFNPNRPEVIMKADTTAASAGLSKAADALAKSWEEFPPGGLHGVPLMSQADKEALLAVTRPPVHSADLEPPPAPGTRELPEDPLMAKARELQEEAHATQAAGSFSGSGSPSNGTAPRAPKGTGGAYKNPEKVLGETRAWDLGDAALEKALADAQAVARGNQAKEDAAASELHAMALEAQVRPVTEEEAAEAIAADADAHPSEPSTPEALKSAMDGLAASERSAGNLQAQVKAQAEKVAEKKVAEDDIAF